MGMGTDEDKDEVEVEVEKERTLPDLIQLRAPSPAKYLNNCTSGIKGKVAVGKEVKMKMKTKSKSNTKLKIFLG